MKKALSVLQVSAADRNILVGSPKTIASSRRVTDATNEKFKVPKIRKAAVDKENVPALRRSKRKNADNAPGIKKSNSLDTEKPTAKASRPKAKKQPISKAFSVDKAEPSSSSCSSAVSPCSPANSVSSVEFNQQTCNVTVNRSFTDEMCMLTSSTPTESYWQQIAEQRRHALEAALLENEKLTDQIYVLQGKLSLYQNYLEAAEKLLKMEGLVE